MRTEKLDSKQWARELQDLQVWWAVPPANAFVTKDVLSRIDKDLKSRDSKEEIVQAEVEGAFAGYRIGQREATSEDE